MKDEKEILNILNKAKEIITEKKGISVHNLRYELSKNEIKIDKARLHDILNKFKDQAGLSYSIKNNQWIIRNEKLVSIEAVRQYTGNHNDIAIQLLMNLLSHEEMRDILNSDGFYNEFRVFLKIEEGRDSSGKKLELAQAIIARFNYDLFKDEKIRELIAKKTKCNEIPKKWQPGSISAKEFCTEVGFPIEFSGQSSPPKGDLISFFSKKKSLLELKPFQEEVKEKIKSSLDKGIKGIISLPTGAGKTRVAVDTILDWVYQNNRKGIFCNILWLTHTKELAAQGYNTFFNNLSSRDFPFDTMLINLWENDSQKLELNSEFGSRRKKSNSIIVAMPKSTLNSLKQNSIMDEFVGNVSIVVIDEAHRAGAKTYLDILARIDEVNQKYSTIGLTATPIRASGTRNETEETSKLISLFRDKIFYSESLGKFPKKKLQELGILSEPIYKTFKTNFELKLSAELLRKIRNDEEVNLTDQEIAKSTDNAKRRAAIISELVNICKDSKRKLIYFGPTVTDSEFIAFMLRNKGIKAAHIDGHTSDGSRKRCINEFSRGDLQVLCNCEVLTTGYDEPSITDVFIARATVSKVLYEQMIGRGLRGAAFGGTEKCTIHFCEDIYQSEANLPLIVWDDVLNQWEKPIEFVDVDSTAKKLNMDFSYNYQERELFLKLFKNIGFSEFFKISTSTIESFLLIHSGEVCNYLKNNNHELNDKNLKYGTLAYLKGMKQHIVDPNDEIKNTLKELSELVDREI